MGYFTETMALFEFKGDAELSYAHKRYDERFTNRHATGKYAHKSGVNAVSSNIHSGGSGNWKEDGNSIVKDKQLGSNASERMKKYNSSSKKIADDMNKSCDKSRKHSKSWSKVREKRYFSEAFDLVSL